MSHAYFITGTDTEIGKTHSAVRLIEHWRSQGLRVAAMKPVASGCSVGADGQLVNDDVERLIAASGQTDRDAMNPYRFAPPISPHLAARLAGVDIDLDLLRQRFAALQADADMVLVEGAGGWYAPLTDTLSMADLACALEIPVVLVVGLRLGCINHARLTAQAIRASGAPLAGWIANQPVADVACRDEVMATLKRTLDAPLWREIGFGG